MNTAQGRIAELQDKVEEGKIEAERAEGDRRLALAR